MKKDEDLAKLLAQQERDSNPSKQQEWGTYLSNAASSVVAKSQQFLSDLGATTDAFGGVGEEEEKKPQIAVAEFNPEQYEPIKPVGKKPEPSLDAYDNFLQRLFQHTSYYSQEPVKTEQSYIALEGRKLFEDCLSYAQHSMPKKFEATIRKTIAKNIAVGRDDITLEMLRFNNKNEKAENEDENKILHQKGKPAVVILQELAEHRVKSTNSSIKEELDRMYGDEKEREEVHYLLLNPEIDMMKIDAIIKQASKKLEKEKMAANRSSMFWKQTDSVTKAKDGRWMINVPGRVYDIVESMLHSVGKVIGLSQPTAAELFAQAAKEAQKMAKEALKGQVVKDRVQARDGHSWSLGSLKAEGMDDHSLVQKDGVYVLPQVAKKDKERADSHTAYSKKEFARSAIAQSKTILKKNIVDISKQPLKKFSTQSIDNRKAALQKFLELEEQVNSSVKTELNTLRGKMQVVLDSSDHLNSRLQEQRLLLAKNNEGGYEYVKEMRLAAQKECLKLLLSKPSLSANERGELSSLLVSEKIETRGDLLTALSNDAEVAEMRRTLFPDSIHIDNRKIKGKADMDRVAEVMKRLDKLGIEEVQAFKAEVSKIAPSQDSWRGKVLQSVGLRDGSKTKGF